jgi:cystathionine beta-lyase
MSTVVFPDYAAYLEAEEGRFSGFTYGTDGSPTTETLRHTLMALEGAEDVLLTSSGLSAVTTALLAFLKPGDHVLIADHTYGPIRLFANRYLKRMGVEVEFYDPLMGAGIASLMRPSTRVVLVESPGSQTMEVQDVPAIAKAAHAGGAIVLSDSTWASPMLWRPFELGIDISAYAATKYVSGHSDMLMGVVSGRKDLMKTVRQMQLDLGEIVSSDNAYLAMRGLRTMPLRLKQHEAAALKVAKWVEKRPEVERVLHPAMPSCPGHEMWKRDYCGSNGLFSFVTHEPCSVKALSAMIDGLRHFSVGYSWGGYESLITTKDVRRLRSATHWDAKGTLIRLHIGLENPDDLIHDLEQGFERLNQAMKRAA